MVQAYPPEPHRLACGSSQEMGKNVWDVMIDDKAPRNAVNHPLNPRKGR